MMRAIRQMAVILAACFAGETIRALVPLNIPAGIYGLVILFLLLEFKAVRLEDVKNTGDFLTGNMQLMFIPSTVGLIAAFGVLRTMALPLLVIIPVTTVLVLAVTGLAAQLLTGRRGR